MDFDVEILLKKLAERAQTMTDPRISYEDAGKWIEQPARSPVLAEALGRLIELDRAAGRPLLSVLVGQREDKQTLGFPGDGFWKACKAAGIQDPGTDNLAFWTEQFRQVQNYYSA